MTPIVTGDIAAAVRAVEAGEVIGLPTDTVYGIGVDPTRRDATDRVFAVKGRPDSIALPVLVGEPDEVEKVAEVGESAERLIGRWWPGVLTIVLPRRPPGSGVPALYLGGDDLTIGVRCPANEAARSLLRLTGPLAVTSANLHGEAPAATPEALAAALGEGISVVLDGGRCEGAPSTVVSLVDPALPVCLRAGAIAVDDLAEALGRPVAQAGA